MKCISHNRPGLMAIVPLVGMVSGLYDAIRGVL